MLTNVLIFDSCIALVPTLQVHFLHSVSSRKLVQRLGCHELDLCMMVVNELKVTYFGADILSRLFTRARETINSKHRGLETTLSGTEAGDVVSPEDRHCPTGEIAMPASPMLCTSNVTGNDWRVTSPRYVLLDMRALDAAAAGQGISNEAIFSNVYEEAGINSILSECMFPDFATAMEAMGVAGTSHPWNGQV